MLVRYWGTWLPNEYLGAECAALRGAASNEFEDVFKILLEDLEGIHDIYCPLPLYLMRGLCVTALDHTSSRIIVEMLAKRYFEDQVWDQYHHGLQRFVQATRTRHAQVVKRLIPQVTSHPALLNSFEDFITQSNLSPKINARNSWTRFLTGLMLIQARYGG